MKNDEINPRDVKMVLAEEVVKMLYNEEEAKKQKIILSLFFKKACPMIFLKY